MRKNMKCKKHAKFMPRGPSKSEHPNKGLPQVECRGADLYVSGVFVYRFENYSTALDVQWNIKRALHKWKLIQKAQEEPCNTLPKKS